MNSLLNQVLATSLAEWVAVVLAIAYVLLAARENAWCWLCAFVSTAIYTGLFWSVSLPFQSLLNAFYMIMAIYGYYQWQQGKGHSTALLIKRWPVIFHVTGIVSCIALAWLLSVVVASQFNSEHLQLDAAINVLSMLTTFMVAHKVLENWIYWFFINAAAAYLYWQTGLVLSSVLFLGYVGFSAYGYLTWYKQWKQINGLRVDNHSA